jgi:dinuclear metal center YbgI/SA1388 family protein
MKLRDLIQFLESKAPLSLQETYDNSGLIVGDAQGEVSSALVCLDSTEAVIDEAIAKKIDLVIAHHPIVFSGLKKFTGSSYIERVIMKAIRHNISIYAIHTNLDNVLHGVNGRIASLLELEHLRPLAAKRDLLQKLRVYVPRTHSAAVLNGLFAAGAGHIGAYSDCSFTTSGTGSFTPGEGTKPFVGSALERHLEEEDCIEVLVEKWHLRSVLSAMEAIHPYEEVAYDLISLDNTHNQYGSGAIGVWPESKTEHEALHWVKQKLGVSVIRHSAMLGKPIKSVAVCGGSGSFLLPQALRSGADLYVTSDFKYHQFFDSEGGLIIADIGHYESEQHTIDLLCDWLVEKFPTFAIHKTGEVTNPINYF